MGRTRHFKQRFEFCMKVRDVFRRLKFLASKCRQIKINTRMCVCFCVQVKCVLVNINSQMFVFFMDVLYL